ncbi:MAG: bifunctional alpha/beta hydrolase/OsmC family protein, partial [Deferrisomatales bacterium]
IPEAAAVVAVAAPSDTRSLARELRAQAPGLDEAGAAEVAIAGRRVRIGRGLLADLEEGNLAARLGRLGRPLLLLHSPADAVVPIDHARRLYQAARHPKSFVSLDDAGHLLDREADARYAAEVIVAWASRYLPAPPAPAAAGDGEVVVWGGPQGYAQEIAAGPHRLAADEPATVAGGTDTGPTPYGLLLAALGACTSMTLRMYADRKGWPLAATRVRLRHHKVHAEDCRECDTQQGMVDVIEREIEAEGPLDEAQRGRLLQIADRCPVHRTLTSEIRVRSRLVGPDSGPAPVA